MGPDHEGEFWVWSRKLAGWGSPFDVISRISYPESEIRTF